MLYFVTVTANPGHADCLPPTDTQTCITGIRGFVEEGNFSQEDLCSIYRETLYCVQKKMLDQGLHCSLADIGLSMASNYTALSPARFNYGSCTLIPEVGNICLNNKRLATFTLILCEPYLSLMQTVGDATAACAYSASLVQCAQRRLGLISAQCSTVQIEEAFRSQATTTFLSKHATGVNLDVCFKTIGVSTTNTYTICTDHYSIFTEETPICLLHIMQVNLSLANNMTRQERNMGCSSVREGLACKERKLAHAGIHCSMEEIKLAMNYFLHVQGEPLVQECPVNESYVSTSMCEDDFRLVSFYTMKRRIVLEEIDENKQNNSKDYICRVLACLFYMDTEYFDVTCPTSKIYAAFVSPFGRSFVSAHYPNLDFDHCVAGGFGTTYNDTSRCHH